MTISTDDLLNSILESFTRISYVHADDIPNIDLYMDQVTTFMDQHMRSTTRNPAEDKILTKTMINNYAKNNLLPPPVKKKYSKEHVLILIFIYYFKGILSINDIQDVLKPITEQYFGGNGSIPLEEIYDDVFSLEDEQVELLKEDVKAKFLQSQTVFEDAPDSDKEFLQKFAFISMLGFDVYVKKLLIEKIIDGMRADNKGANVKEKKPENKKQDSVKD